MDEEMQQRVFQQVMDIFVIPEIEKRKKQGEIKKNFILSKAQIVFSLKTGKNAVRLNDEIKGIVSAKLNTPKEKGDAILHNEIEDIEKVEMVNEDKNSAHITLILVKGKWFISFDFRYNKELAKEHTNASIEFYESAKNNLENNRLRPFFEDAFASAELSAKSILLLLPDKEILFGKSHDDRIKKLTQWAELGNVKIEFSTTLSKLKSLRSSARYLSSDDYEKEDTGAIIKTIEEMINFAKRSVE